MASYYPNTLRASVILAGMAIALAVVGAALPLAMQPAQAAFPGNNGKIAFHIFHFNPPGTDPRHDQEIFTINPDGTGIVQITRNTVGDAEPAFSPDGRKIAFVRSRDIYTMSATGARQFRLTRSPSRDSQPTWSSNGRTIAFSSERNGNRDIYAVNQSGSSLRRLTTDPARDRSPAWSPDGTKIAFVRHGSIFVMKAARESTTNIPQRLTRALRSWVGDSAPVWSPDGTRIAFQGLKEGDLSRRIYMINADGSGLTRLTSAPQPLRFDAFPAWSPDGTKIAFVRHPGNIFVMDAAPESETNRPVRITRNRIQKALDWQPLP